MRFILPGALVALVAGVMFQLRPGTEQLREQILAPSRLGGSNHLRSDSIIGQAFQNLAKVAQTRSSTAAPIDLSTEVLDDYRLFTVFSPKKEDLRFVGVLGNFVPYVDKDDVVVLVLFIILFVLLKFAVPRLIEPHCTPSLYRPWGLLLGGFYSSSFLSAVSSSAVLINTGPYMQTMIGREEFLLVYLGTTVLVSLVELVVRGKSYPVGTTPASFAILIHSTLLRPETRYQLFGMNLNGFSLIGVQILLPMVGGSPRAALLHLAPCIGGLCVGLCSFCVLSEPRAELLLKTLSIPLGTGQSPPSLVFPILGLYVLLTGATLNF